MNRKAKRRRRRPPNEELPKRLPSGIKLLHTLAGHKNVTSIAFDPQGETLATGGISDSVHFWDVKSGKLIRPAAAHWDVRSLAFDPLGQRLATAGALVKLWEVQSGRLLHTLAGHTNVTSIAFDPQGETLASGDFDGRVNLSDVQSGELIRRLEGHAGPVNSIAFDPMGGTLASGGSDGKVNLWEVQSGRSLRTFVGRNAAILSVMFDPTGGMLAVGRGNGTVNLVDVQSGKLIRRLEGHTGHVDIVAFSSDGRFLASKSGDHTICLWRCETWDTIAVIQAPILDSWIPVLAFHPTLPLLVASVSDPDAPEAKPTRLVHVWELAIDVLLGKRAEVTAVHHTTGKIVLVGDHGVGKSALGYRMVHGMFKKQESTHGQQFWVFPELSKRREDGTECEAILWDFAGQPDYRLVHALFVDDADLALVLFDASDIRDPLHGVGFWLKQLKWAVSSTVRDETQKGGTTSVCPTILVAAQTDRGSCSLTTEELQAFCQRHGIVGPVVTSARTGEGVAELIERMKAMIPWEDKPATVTTKTFKRIKDYVLDLKEAESDGQMIVAPEELRGRLEATDGRWRFTDAEMLTAVGHLENYGYVRRLQSTSGEERILLEPERLNNLASSFVLEARRNPKGLGALEEKRLLAGGYAFPELTDLDEDDGDVLLDSATLLFLEHNVCFRETDPLRMEPYLVFPELINLKKPQEEEQATEDGVAYTVRGPTENVFASLVVLLGYTHTFTRASQWQNNARYEVGDGMVCGFREEAERDGELDFVLCFGMNVGQPVRTLFQGLFESFLARRNVIVMRFEPVYCTNVECGQLLDRAVVRQRLKTGKAFACCNECGEKLALPKLAERIQLTSEAVAEVKLQRRAAEQRTRFEQAVFRVQAYVVEHGIKPPECFISYAWGVPEHEHWVENRLATDLQKAGVRVVLDRWHNAKIGAGVPRFVERVHKSDQVIVVGTPLYREKYENGDPMRGYVVAAEGDLIGKRMIGTEEEKRSVLPLLLSGTDETSLPDLLQGRVYADFRDDGTYFATAFNLILSIYQLEPSLPAVADLRESLQRLSRDPREF